MREYEYALQMRVDDHTWRVVGTGPARDIESIRADLRGWAKISPHRQFRIVRRKVEDWKITDQSYVSTWMNHVAGKDS